MERTAPIWVCTKLNPNSAVEHGVVEVDAVDTNNGIMHNTTGYQGQYSRFRCIGKPISKKKKVPSELILINKHYKSLYKTITYKNASLIRIRTMLFKEIVLPMTYLRPVLIVVVRFLLHTIIKGDVFRRTRILHWLRRKNKILLRDQHPKLINLLKAQIIELLQHLVVSAKEVDEANVEITVGVRWKPTSSSIGSKIGSKGGFLLPFGFKIWELLSEIL